MLESAVAFVAVSAVVICTPGQDTALTVRNTLAGGRRGGIATAAGVALGQAVWTLAASAGVVALLSASEPAFRALKLMGAAYLVYLGAQSLYSALSSRAHGHRYVADGERAAPTQALRQGLISNLGNPKMAVFFASLLPQFVPAGQASFSALLLLGVVFAAMTFAWLSLYAIAVAKAGDVLRRPFIRRWIEGVTGALLIGLGVRIAAEQR